MSKKLYQAQCATLNYAEPDHTFSVLVWAKSEADAKAAVEARVMWPGRGSVTISPVMDADDVLQEEAQKDAENERYRRNDE